jgi:hypothetical protein
MKRAGLTPGVVEELLRRFHGNMSAVARHYGCSRQAVARYCARREALRAVVDDTRESMKDDAESALYEAVLRGESWAVKMYLLTQAKDRGYTYRQEVAAKDWDAVIPAFVETYLSGPAPGLDGHASPP